VFKIINDTLSSINNGDKLQQLNYPQSGEDFLTNPDLSKVTVIKNLHKAILSKSIDRSSIA